MSLWDRVTGFMALQPVQDRIELSAPDFPDLPTQIATIRAANRSFRRATINEALGVPAIQRAVTLISHTVGSVSMQGWREGSPMPRTPIVIGRPNPYETPYDFYRDSAYFRATRGETVWWIANRDGEGFPIALVNVPPWELTVQANPNNRFRPTYQWMDNVGSLITSTRYSPANPRGDFVHIMYHRDDSGLRGIGPLQMCGVAVSVAVEAQQWASSMFAGGGVPPIIVKTAGELDPTVNEDYDGLNEAQRFKLDWSSSQPNEPKIVDQNVESVTQLNQDTTGAQMLDARSYENGDAARMFGIPGVLLEYNMSGSSLTYQSIPDVWIELLRGCLTPTYFEPLESHLSDLLPRTQSARFNTRGLQRADIKTRFEVYQIGIDSGVMTKEQAQQDEGYIPGDIELMPVPPSPPQAAVGLSRSTNGFRCEGSVTIRGAVRKCNAKLAETGTFGGTCRRCGKRYAAA